MSDHNLSGMQKAALLLKSMPSPVAAKVLNHLAPPQASQLRAELAKIAERSDLKRLLAQVLDEAAEALSDGDGISGKDAGRKDRATSPSAAKNTAEAAPSVPMEPKSSRIDLRLSDSAATAAPGLTDPIAALVEIPADVLAQALEGESTRTVAVLMNALNVDIAAAIYKRISPAKRKELSMRFTEPAHINDELLKRIAQAVVGKCRALRTEIAPGAADPAVREKRMAAMLRGLERAERIDMIALLEQNDAELAGRIKAMLYQFEDILRMQNISVQKLLADIDTKSLALALSDAAPELRDRLFSNLSKRAQEALKEEIDLAGSVPTAKARQAQQTVADAIQRLDQRDELLLIE